MRVLIDVANGRVTDELIEALTRAGHTVERGSAAVAAARFDVVIVGSVEATERLAREHPGRAVIAFTRVGDVEARIRALEVGAADAVDASFLRSQLVARVGAAGRRAVMISPVAERIAIDGCAIDLSSCSCTRDGEVRALTRREVDIVRWLSRRAGQVVSRQELLEHVWRVSPRSETRAVDVAIAMLRKKLERDPGAPAIIVSIKGAGYRWGPG